GAPTIQQQFVTDANGILAESKAIAAAIETNAPGALNAQQQAQIAGWQSAAADALASLSASTPAAAGASKLQVAETALNNALSAIGAALPAAAALYPALAPYVPLYDAAVALLPGLEAYVNSLVPSSAVAAGKMAAPIGGRLSPAQARALLGIPTS
ncbi:MAG: hypothetical protein JSS56_27830, partial [Proteobacteria bacterium]|nr:hypothetical protein [Pseudomonadota bacterium]